MKSDTRVALRLPHQTPKSTLNIPLTCARLSPVNQLPLPVSLHTNISLLKSLNCSYLPASISASNTSCDAPTYPAIWVCLSH